jgi:oligopeptide transport system ATP-binding protein
MTATPATFLKLEGVKTHFPLYGGMILKKRVGEVRAVDGVDLELRQGEILGLVGESGCGKSTLSRTIMQLLPVTAGKVFLEGSELTSLPTDALREKRRDIQMIFQDPYASLNPRYTIFDTLAEALRTRHPDLKGKPLFAAVSTLMNKVGLDPRFMLKYPHEFSGGQRQRIAIARALAPEPKLILADEPVSALDVSIQSQILNLIKKLVREMGLTMIFVSHDLSVVKYISDRVAVMYLGKIVETGPSQEVIENPQHPYSRALISAIPVPDPDKERARRRIVLEGDLPSPSNPPKGCSFHPRCPYAVDACKATVPPLEEQASGRRAACIRLGEI